MNVEKSKKIKIIYLSVKSVAIGDGVLDTIFCMVENLQEGG